MKNRSNFKSLLAGFGLASLIIGGVLPLRGQDAEQKTRKVRVKMITEINGKQTVVDTVMEISGDLPHPDLKRLEKFRTESGRPMERNIEAIKIMGPDGKNFRSPEEIQKLIDKAAKFDVKIINPEALKGEFLKDKNFENGQVKIYKLAEPGATFTLDSTETRKIMIFKNGALTENKIEIREMMPEIKALRERNFEKLREFSVLRGDSQMVFKRMIIVQHDELTDSEKEMLETTAKKESSKSKITNLELENADLYPNPNNGVFNLAFDVNKKTNTTITVIDAVGKEVYRENLKNFKGRYQKEIDLRHLSKGMYYLQVNQGKHVYNKKLVLQ